MNQRTEKELYIKKSYSMAEKITKILNMESCGVITDDMRKHLEKIQSEAETVYHKLKNNEFEIAIVGLEKAGKSSFSNALIEKNLLPTDDQRCTYTATCIRYAENDSAIITFYDNDRFEKDFKDKLAKAGIKNAESYSYRSLSLGKYDDLYENRNGNGSRYDETLNQDIRNIIINKDEISKYLGNNQRNYKEDELKQNEFQGFIKEPRKAIAVEEVIIYSKVLGKMSNAVIYDVPGFNSPTEMHKQQTLDKMRSADAIIMVAKGDEPSLTGDVLKIFRESDNDGTLLRDKLFIFANKSDRATDFEKNRIKTYEQWIENYKYIKENEQWRIVFGSANAHLQRCGEIKGDEYIKAVEAKKLPDGDGIEQIRTTLEQYNETQRFEVLKRRINKLNEDLNDIFKDVAQANEEIESYQSNKGTALGVELCHEAENNIPELLDSYMGEIRDDMLSKPLSKDICNKIDEIVSVNAYQITEDEITKAHKEFAGISQDEQISRVENKLREVRNYDMYARFNKEIVNMALGAHKRCEEEIINKCIEALGMKKDLDTTVEVKRRLKNLFESQNIIEQGEGNYYQSLIERYAKDVYEILIYSPYTGERLAKFYEDINNFYSLSIFYKEKEDDKGVSYSNKRIKDLPMCRRLLFHEDEARQNTAKACEKVKDFFKDNSDELLELVISIGKIAPSKVINIVSEICSELYEDKNLDKRTQLVEAKMELNRQLREQQEINTGAVFVDITDKENFEIQYKNFHAERSRNYESVRQDFSDDVEILHDILQNAFVYAINVEKPFVAREKHMIDDIKKFVREAGFRKFIVDNMRLIKFEEYNKIKAEDDNSKVKMACIQEIRELLSQINQVS